MINFGIRYHTYSRCSEPLSCLDQDIKRLTNRLKLLTVPFRSALDVFHFTNLRDTHVIIHGITSDDYPLAFYRCRAAPFMFVSTMEILKKWWWLHHDDLKQRNEDNIESYRPLWEERPRMKRSVRITCPQLSPLLPLLNLGKRFLIVEEICNTPVSCYSNLIPNDAMSS